MWVKQLLLVVFAFRPRSLRIVDLPCVKKFLIRSYSGQYFPALGLNMERYSVSLRIQSEFGKIGTIISPNANTFHAVLFVACPAMSHCVFRKKLFFIYTTVNNKQEHFMNHNKQEHFMNHNKQEHFMNLFVITSWLIFSMRPVVFLYQK